MFVPRLSPKAGLGLLLDTGVCAIIDDGINSPPAMLGLVRDLKRWGIGVFQLRCKRTPDGRFLDLARKMRRILSGHVLFINDRCDIARLCSADGVHLGSDDLSPGAARRVIGRRVLVGVSAGNEAQLAAARSCRPDYISIGPAFQTATKADAGPALGAAGFRRLGRGIPRGCLRLAVGGITPHNVGVLFRAGADAVAVASWWGCCGSRKRAVIEMLGSVRAAREREPRSGKGLGIETRRWRT